MNLYIHKFAKNKEFNFFFKGEVACILLQVEMGVFDCFSFRLFIVCETHIYFLFQYRSKIMDFVNFQNFHSFFIYFVCFLTEWSLSKSHKFHKKGIIHLAYSSVLLHIFCICTVLLLWLVEIRPGTWSELECTVKIICFILMFVKKFFSFKYSFCTKLICF